MLGGFFGRLFRRDAAAQPAPASPPKRTNNGNGGRASVQIARACPHCGKVTKGPGHFKHVAKCSSNPNRAPLQAPAGADDATKGA